MGVMTTWGLCLFQVGPLALSHFGVCKWGYLVFGRKETGAKRVTMTTTLRAQVVSFVMDIYGAKSQEH